MKALPYLADWFWSERMFAEANDTAGEWVQVDPRTGVVYSRPPWSEGADSITEEEIDELGLGPGGEYDPR